MTKKKTSKKSRKKINIKPWHVVVLAIVIIIVLITSGIMTGIIPLGYVQDAIKQDTTSDKLGRIIGSDQDLYAQSFQVPSTMGDIH